MLCGCRERSKQRQSSQGSFTHWVLDRALIGLMVEVVGGIVGEDGSDDCVSG